MHPLRRRILMLAIPLSILLTVVTAVAAMESADTPTWREPLDRYLDRRRAAGTPLEVIDVARARLPWKFRQEMGIAVRDPADWRWSIELPPYPPETLYCVRAARTEAPPEDSATVHAVEPAEVVLYVGYHSDRLWRVGWLVHQGLSGPNTQGVAVDLARVGCSFAPP